MRTLAEIEAAAGALSAQEKANLLEFLAAQLKQSRPRISVVGRRSGLHAGVWEVAADFDTPMSDDFWMGT